MKLFLAMLMMLPAVSFAGTKMITAKSANLNLCPYSTTGRPVAVGCVDTIQLNRNKRVQFDLAEEADAELEKCLNRLIGNHRFHKLLKTQKFDVTGFITKEKGRMPNPMVEFEVFHIVDSQKLCVMPLPR